MALLSQLSILAKQHSKPTSTVLVTHRDLLASCTRFFGSSLKRDACCWCPEYSAPRRSQADVCNHLEARWRMRRLFPACSSGDACWLLGSFCERSARSWLASAAGLWFDPSGWARILATVLMMMIFRTARCWTRYHGSRVCNTFEESSRCPRLWTFHVATVSELQTATLKRWGSTWFWLLSREKTFACVKCNRENLQPKSYLVLQG